MSIYTTVYAMESKIQAPEIGDGGYVGQPPVDSSASEHPFNPIYAALARAGLATRELDAFKAFLDKYGNERLYFSMEGDDDSAEAQELNEMLENNDVPTFALDPSRKHTECRYRISCGDDEYVSQYTDYFERIEPMTIEKAELEAFLRVTTHNESNNNDWELAFYNLGGIADPYDGDLGRISEFVQGADGPFQIEFLPVGTAT